MPSIAIAIHQDDPSLPLFGNHVARFEPHVSIEWVFIRSQVVAAGGPCRSVPPEANASAAMLNAIVTALRVDYLLWIEVGWRFSPTADVFLGPCLEALATHPDIAQVKLHSEDSMQFDDRSTYTAIPVPGWSAYDFYVQSPRKVLGGITLAPALTRVDAYRRLGPLLTDLPYTAACAEYCARSTDDECFLTLRSRRLTQFVPRWRPPYRHARLTIEPP